MPKKLIVPFAFAGIAGRCFFVILLYQINFSLLKFTGKRNSNKICQKSNKNQKIKIMRIVSRLNIGGPSIHVTLLAKKMNPARFETILLTGTRSPSEGDMGYLLEDYNGRVKTIFELQREINIAKDLMTFFKLLLIIAKEKPNIVHTHMSKAGTVGRLAAVFWKCIGDKNLKIVHTFHGHVLEGYFSSLKSHIFRFIEIGMARISDKVIAISKSQHWELTRKYKIAHQNKVAMINLGFNLAPFQESYKYKGDLRKGIHIEKDTLLIGIVGRLVPIKNHCMFLEVAKRFITRNPLIDIRFVIVGDGELRDSLELHAEKLGIKEKVIFLGWEKELRKIYADLDILALTSINEGTPVSIIEAMAASVLVITTDVGGVKDLLGNLRNKKSHSHDIKECERGILCPKNNAEAFADGLQYILDKKLYRDSNIISNAKFYVLKNYSEEKLVHKIEELYELLHTKK